MQKTEILLTTFLLTAAKMIYRIFDFFHKIDYFGISSLTLNECNILKNVDELAYLLTQLKALPDFLAEREKL